MEQILKNILKSNLRIFLVLAILGFAAYAIILKTPFKTIDDYFAIVENPDIKTFTSLPKIFSSSFFGSSDYYRPLVYVSFMIEYHFFQLKPFFYNLTNVILQRLKDFAPAFVISCLRVLALTLQILLHLVQ